MKPNKSNPTISHGHSLQSKEVLHIHNIPLIMIEEDYSNWLDAKDKIENFDRISELNKKKIYEVEQKLTGFEAVDLIEVQYFHNSDKNESRLEYYFEWTGHHFGSGKGDGSERTSHEMMMEKLKNRISLSEKDKIYLGFVFTAI